jgi:hypothetical protein
MIGWATLLLALACPSAPADHHRSARTYARVAVAAEKWQCATGIWSAAIG